MPNDTDAGQNLNQAAGPGAKRAAAVLLGLGPELAAQIFPLLDEASVRKIALGAKELKRSPQAVPNALKTYVEALQGLAADVAGGDGVLREIAGRVLGAEAVRRAFDGAAAPPQADEVLGPIGLADPEALSMVLSREQPQTVALVLGAMDPQRGAAVMARLPPAQQPEILRRLAGLESVAPEVLRQVGQALSAELRASVAGGMRKVDGRNAAIEILRRSPATQQAEAMSEIEKDDPELAAELRTKLFTFEDLCNLSDRDVQTFLREADMGRLSVALKGASQEVKDKIMRNMSSRAAQMLADDMAAMGPVRLANVEEAQAELVKVAFNLAEQGRITMVGPADKML